MFIKWDDFKPTARRFDKETAGWLTEEIHEKLHGQSLKDNCPVSKGVTLSRFYKVYAGTQLLKSATDVCHSLDLSLELWKTQEFIQESNYRNYVKGKQFLIEPFKKLFGWDFSSNQKRLGK